MQIIDVEGQEEIKCPHCNETMGKMNVGDQYAMDANCASVKLEVLCKSCKGLVVVDASTGFKAILEVEPG